MIGQAFGIFMLPLRQSIYFGGFVKVVYLLVLGFKIDMFLAR
jgi:hypothetical protein